jgi:hypothetical protein
VVGGDMIYNTRYNPVTEQDFIQILKQTINQKVSNIVPGLIQILNIYCRIRIGYDFYTLLITSPCDLYKALIYFYKDEAASNIVLKLILKNIIVDEESIDKALNHIKKCEGKKFTEILYKNLIQ